MTRFTLGLMALFLFVASVVSVLEIPKPSSAAPKPQLPKLTTCVVKVVYDGDTFGCDMDRDGRVTAQREHVRMLGIDASEMYYSRKNKTGKNQPYAAEATRLVERLTMNQKVYLETDQQPLDKYNRTLAYVYLDGDRKTMLNQLLLEKGLAKILFIGKNRRYEAPFTQQESQARARHTGLW